MRLITLITAVLVTVLLAACGGGGTATVTVTTSAAAKPKPKPHLTAAQKKAKLCEEWASAALDARPTECLTKKQRAKLRQIKAKAAARAKAQKIAAANARAARIAAENAWHKGYFGPIVTDNGQVYAKWIRGTCKDYAVNGCWTLEVTTALGCSSMYVESNEMQGSTIVGSTIASQDNVPPKTPVLLELDSDTSASVTASAPKITCYP